MSQLCQSCGNQIVVGCGPVCLVCQHTGRGNSGRAIEVHARGLAAALDAVYAAMTPKPEQPLTPEEQFREAQQVLRHRICFPGHNRERPDWDEIDAEERERREICQACMGTGRYLARPCPDCQED